MNARAAPPRVYSYVRCSTAGQVGGDTFERQDAAAAAYCARMGWQLDDSLRLTDAGRSAYSGAHLDDKAALGRFIRAAADGLVPRGSVLLVDDQSRLSRLGIYQTMTLMHDLIEVHGIDLVTLNNGTHYTADNWQDVGNWVISGVGAALAHGESKEKARKLRSANAAKRNRARESGEVYSVRLPAWIQIAGDRRIDAQGRRHGGSFALIPDRAALVARMFDLFLAGSGRHKIAATFNAEKIPTWGGAAHWSAVYVQKILTWSAVIGTWEPRGADSPEPIADYFPAAIDPDTFRRAQELASGGRVVGNTAGGASEVRSILAGLAQCPYCNSAMTRIAAGQRDNSQKLICTKGKAGGDCPAPKGGRGGVLRIPLAVIEAGLVAGADKIAGNVPFTNPALAGERDAVAAAVTAKESDIANMVAACAKFGASVPDAIVTALKSAESELVTLKASYAALQRDLSVSESESLSLARTRSAEALRAYSTGTMHAPEVNAALREVFDSIIVDSGARQLELRWKYSTESLRIAY